MNYRRRNQFDNFHRSYMQNRNRRLSNFYSNNFGSYGPPRMTRTNFSNRQMRYDQRQVYPRRNRPRNFAPLNRGGLRPRRRLVFRGTRQRRQNIVQRRVMRRQPGRKQRGSGCLKITNLDLAVTNEDLQVSYTYNIHIL